MNKKLSLQIEKERNNNVLLLILSRVTFSFCLHRHMNYISTSNVSEFTSIKESSKKKKKNKITPTNWSTNI